jgi:hypothetical protein
MQGKVTVDCGFTGGEEVAPAPEDRLKRFEPFGDGIDVLDVSSSSVDPNRPVFYLIIRAC